jgi:hypothetical protein
VSRPPTSGRTKLTVDWVKEPENPILDLKGQGAQARAIAGPRRVQDQAPLAKGDPGVRVGGQRQLKGGQEMPSEVPLPSEARAKLTIQRWPRNLHVAFQGVQPVCSQM